MIIAISGVPCTGKTEVAKKVAKSLGFEYISLNEFSRKNDMCIGFDEVRKCDIVDTESVSEEIKRMKDKNIVIESHFAHEVYSDKLFILRCDTAILRKRMEKRGWGEDKIMENIEAEIMEVIPEEARDYGKDFEEISAEGSVENTSNKIISFLKNKNSG